jgi:signal transduction histidine kinase
VSLSDQFPVRASASERALDRPRIQLDPSARHALPVWVPVSIGGVVGVGFAIVKLAGGSYGWEDFVGIAVLLAAAALAEAFPVPIEGVAVGSMSLATIFLVAVASIYGWAAGGLAGFVAMAVVEAGRSRPLSRIAFNCGIYTLGGIAAGAAAAAVHNGDLLNLVLGSIAAAVCFYLVDISLLAAVVSRSQRLAFPPALLRYIKLTLVPFMIMASLAVILVVLWDRSPYLSIVLAGPLLATAAYQRWIHGALERLREFDRLKDEFIAIVSHELRTPLTSVYGAAMTLGNQTLDEERRDALIDIVSTESARLARLLDQILWVSRLDSGRARAVITSVDVVPLVSEVVDATRTHLPPEVSVELEHEPQPAPVAADPDKLRQVLVNLIENAVKYSGEGTVEVRIRRDDGNMRFSIRDSGRGIPPEEHERVFEKFYRLDPDMTQGVGGTGLGLYICRELIEGMDGRIWLESTPGVGSTFSFELPLANRG